MSQNTLIWLIIIWLLSNALFPLILNSLERLYENKIDFIVERSLKGLSWVFLCVIQMILICYFSPLILILALLERIYPKILEKKFIKNSGITSTMQLLLTKNFWKEFATQFRQSRHKEILDEEKKIE